MEILVGLLTRFGDKIGSLVRWFQPWAAPCVSQLLPVWVPH